jgi:hypothetical protein
MGFTSTFKKIGKQTKNTVTKATKQVAKGSLAVVTLNQVKPKHVTNWVKTPGKLVTKGAKSVNNNVNSMTGAVSKANKQVSKVGTTAYKQQSKGITSSIKSVNKTANSTAKVVSKTTKQIGSLGTSIGKEAKRSTTKISNQTKRTVTAAKELPKKATKTFNTAKTQVKQESKRVESKSKVLSQKASAKVKQIQKPKTSSIKKSASTTAQQPRLPLAMVPKTAQQQMKPSISEESTFQTAMKKDQPVVNSVIPINLQQKVVALSESGKMQLASISSKTTKVQKQVAVGALGVTAVGLFLFLKKKKEISKTFPTSQSDTNVNHRLHDGV